MQDEVLEPLKLIYRSLMDSGDAYIAHAHTLDLIRQACNLDLQITMASPRNIQHHSSPYT